MKILIDAGHGGADSGAVGNGLLEKNINLDIALREKALFEALGHEVHLTRNSDVFVSLSDRTNLANSLKVDLALSDHVNAGGGEGEEVWCSIYGGVGRDVAGRVESRLDDFFKDRGVKTKEGTHGDYLAFIRETDMPAILVEFGFIDNVNDAAKLSDDSFRQKCAEAVVMGVLNINSIPNPNPIPEPTPIPVPTPAVPAPIESKVDADVLEVQKKLNRLGFVGANGKRLTEDGLKGANTTYAITKFQGIVGLVADGSFGPKSSAAADEIFAKPVLRIGAKNFVPVRYLQWRAGAGVDGSFGPATKNAIIRLQRSKGLSADGIVGPASWKSLIG